MVLPIWLESSFGIVGAVCFLARSGTQGLAVRVFEVLFSQRCFLFLADAADVQRKVEDGTACFELAVLASDWRI